MGAVTPVSEVLGRLGYGFTFFCPGCKRLHLVTTNPPKKGVSCWAFNDDVDKPTFSPSVLVTWVERSDGEKIVDKRCHLFVREGFIEFLTDCTHALAGQTVKMLPLPDWCVDKINGGAVGAKDGVA